MQTAQLTATGLQFNKRLIQLGLVAYVLGNACLTVVQLTGAKMSFEGRVEQLPGLILGPWGLAVGLSSAFSVIRFRHEIDRAQGRQVVLSAIKVLLAIVAILAPLVVLFESIFSRTVNLPGMLAYTALLYYGAMMISPILLALALGCQFLMRPVVRWAHSSQGDIPI